MKKGNRRRKKLPAPEEKISKFFTYYVRLGSERFSARVVLPAGRKMAEGVRRMKEALNS